jgi:hypothetical protein
MNCANTEAKKRLALGISRVAHRESSDITFDRNKKHRGQNFLPNGLTARANNKAMKAV